MHVPARKQLRAEGISYSKLLYWRKKFGEGVRPSAAKSPPPRPQLIPVQVKPDRGPADPASKFEVWFPDGTALDVPSGFNEIDLRRLISALRPC